MANHRVENVLWNETTTKNSDFFEVNLYLNWYIVSNRVTEKIDVQIVHEQTADYRIVIVYAHCLLPTSPMTMSNHWQQRILHIIIWCYAVYFNYFKMLPNHTRTLNHEYCRIADVKWLCRDVHISIDRQHCGQRSCIRKCIKFWL